MKKGMNRMFGVVIVLMAMLAFGVNVVPRAGPNPDENGVAQTYLTSMYNNDISAISDLDAGMLLLSAAEPLNICESEFAVVSVLRESHPNFPAFARVRNTRDVDRACISMAVTFGSKLVHKTGTNGWIPLRV